MCKFRRQVLVLVALIVPVLAAVRVPICSNVFKFANYDNYDEGYYGSLKFKNDLSGTYDLKVKILFNSTTKDSQEELKIVRETSDEDVKNGEDVVYSFQFPSKNRFPPKLPAIFLVEFNNAHYCGTPFEEGAIVLSDRNKFSVATRPRSTTSKPPRTPSNQNLQSAKNRIEPITSHSTGIQSSWMESMNGQNCGTRKEVTRAVELVLNGEPVEEGNFPWMVALMYYEPGSISYKCAGTLVSDRHVITAAHCIYNNADKMKIFVVLGTLNIKNWTDKKSTIRFAQKIIKHPQFVAVSDYDVAVIVLDAPVTFSDLISPACLWNERKINSLSDIYNQEGSIAGWGHDQTGKIGDKPKQIDLPIVNYATCIHSDPTFMNLLSERSFCAGERKGKIPCTGDSGSGFMLKRQGKWTLGGVVSAALSNGTICHSGHYAVFVDIPKYIPWLKKIFSEN